MPKAFVYKTLHLPPEVGDRLDAVAEVLGVEPSQVLEQAITAYFDSLPPADRARIEIDVQRAIDAAKGGA